MLTCQGARCRTVREANVRGGLGLSEGGSRVSMGVAKVVTSCLDSVGSIVSVAAVFGSWAHHVSACEVRC